MIWKNNDNNDIEIYPSIKIEEMTNENIIHMSSKEIRLEKRIDSRK